MASTEMDCRERMASTEVVSPLVLQLDLEFDLLLNVWT